MRLNRYIAESGYCSRRKADALIEAGKVTRNGEVALLGTIVEDGDVICVEGVPVGGAPGKVYILLNKPRGIECTADPGTAHNVVAFIGLPERIYPVGRLDRDSEGMLLLTNDGDFADFIMRAANHHEKEYEVEIDGWITEAFIKDMGRGVDLDGRKTRPCKVWPVGPRRFRIVLTQGMNRQIRRMTETLGYKVVRLKRVRILQMTLEDLAVGNWRYLSAGEVQAFYRAGNVK